MTQSTTISLVDQLESAAGAAPDVCEGPAGSCQQVLAGVDDLLETLNQLIIEPISKKHMYDQYGELVVCPSSGVRG